MKNEISNLLETYIAAYPKIKDEINNLTNEEINFLPSPDKWSIRQILHHLCDSEMMAVTRVFRILTEEKPSLPSYNQNKWVSELGYDKLDPQVAVLTFGLLRQRLYQLYQTLPESVWERKGVHSEKGEITLFDMLKTYAKHGENHLQQIQKNLSEYKSKVKF
jgi:hypothetical protein